MHLYSIGLLLSKLFCQYWYYFRSCVKAHRLKDPRSNQKIVAFGEIKFFPFHKTMGQHKNTGRGRTKFSSEDFFEIKKFRSRFLKLLLLKSNFFQIFVFWKTLNFNSKNFKNRDREFLTSQKYFFDRIFLMKIQIFKMKPLQNLIWHK